MKLKPSLSCMGLKDCGPWEQPRSEPPPSLSGGDTGRAISPLSDSFASSGKTGRMPTSWDHGQQSLGILTTLMASISRMEIMCQRFTPDCSIECLPWPCRGSIVTFLSLPKCKLKIREIKNLAQGLTAGSSPGWHSNPGS